MRFSLRSLFAAMTLAAAILGGWFAWRQATMCQIQWLPPESKEAAGLFPAVAVGGPAHPDHELPYGFVYYARRTSAQNLLRATRGRTVPPGGSSEWRIDGETIYASTDSPETAQAQIDALETADVPDARTFLIRGRVTDRAGQPLAGATIDLHGPFVFINYFRTRDDGTFTMPLTDGVTPAPAGSGYWLQVRAASGSGESESRWNTPAFTLDPQQPERAAMLVVPR